MDKARLIKKQSGADNLWNHGDKPFTLAFMLKGKRDGTALAPAPPCHLFNLFCCIIGCLGAFETSWVYCSLLLQWPVHTEWASRMAVDFSGMSCCEPIVWVCHSSHVCACDCVFQQADRTPRGFTCRLSRYTLCFSLPVAPVLCMR